MWAEQAIFTSARTSTLRGYHLVASSSGVDNQLAKALIPWGPSHGALTSIERHAQSLNFHSVAEDWWALSRTVYGGPEYSERGGMQLFTRFLLVRSDRLAGYDFDPLALAETAIALGQLRFEPQHARQMPTVELPDHPLPFREYAEPPAPQSDATIGFVEVLENNGRIALVGTADPRSVLADLFGHYSGRQRLRVSFATGLKPSLYRPFRIHFLRHLDPRLRRQLDAQGITVIALPD